MGLVNLKEIFREDTSIWAVGAFNVHNLEFIRAVVEEAEELRSRRFQSGI
jgi:fructose/tagatose bisphosphate aldolase